MPIQMTVIKIKMDELLQNLITSNFFFARILVNFLTFKIYANSNVNYKLFHSKCILCENTFPPKSDWVHGFVVAHVFVCDDCTGKLELNTNKRQHILHSCHLQQINIPFQNNP